MNQQMREMYVSVENTSCIIYLIMSNIKKKYQAILVDLDGTVIDSGPGIMESVQYALGKMGYEQAGAETLRKFVGPSLMDSFTHLYPMSKEEAEQATAYYREVYSTGNMFHFDLYEGIVSCLQELKKAGKRLILVTSKPHVYAARILEKADVSSYFEYQTGPELSDASSQKVRLIEKAIAACGLQKEETVMVGDTHFDIDGAVQAGIDSIGVTYGYGKGEELKEAGATYLVSSTEELKSLLLEGKE